MLHSNLHYNKKMEIDDLDEYYNDDEIFSKVEGNSNLVRERETGAIINVNNSEYQSYIINSRKILSERKKAESIEKELNGIKNDINEIKDLLRSLSQNK